MRRMLLGSLAFAAAVSFVNESSAHIVLTSPASRHPANGPQKSAPCGASNDARGDDVTVFAPGETITVEWYESVNHPGHFRIMFDDDGFDDFPNPTGEGDLCQAGVGGCLADNIADAAGGAGTYSTQVTLPDIACENCTIQVIQMMTESTPVSMYYRCADVALRAGAGEAAASSSSSGGATGASAGAGDDDGGCSFSGTGGSFAPAALASLAMMAFAARGRRRRG